MELRGKQIACIIAHPDDELIGCGGTLRRAVREGASVRVVLPLFRTDERGIKNWDAIINQFQASCKMLGTESVIPEIQLSEEEAEPKVGELHKIILPWVNWADLILTHWQGDVHQAHRGVSRAVEISTRPFRQNKNVICFEIATSTDQAFRNTFSPNLNIILSDEDVEYKCKAMSLYDTESASGRSPKDLEMRARFRGSQISTKYAEAFVIERMFI